MEIILQEKLLQENDHIADENRRYLNAHNTKMVNIISSPGAGKTTFLEALLPVLEERSIHTAVIEGDQQTTRDAERIAATGTHAVQISTGQSCHLNAQSIHTVLQTLPLQNLDLVLIENVGNLVCPAEFDLGETIKIALSSTTEGDDKPAKYPLLFTESPFVILNKTDLLPYVQFDTKKFFADIRILNPEAVFCEISALTHEGIHHCADTLLKRIT